MDPATGLVIYLVLLVIACSIAGMRGLPLAHFILLPLALSFTLTVLGAIASGGSGTAMAWAFFLPVIFALLASVAMRSKAQKLAAGEMVEGYKKCPDCAEP